MKCTQKLIPLICAILIIPVNSFAEKVPCGVEISSEYFVATSSAVYIEVNISAKNSLSDPVDAVTWNMYSKTGKLLFSDTWIGAIQKPDFYYNPEKIGIIQIGPGDTTALKTPPGRFRENIVEFFIGNPQGSDGSEMKELFEKRLRETEEKYSNVACEVVGYVKKLNY